MPLLDVLNAVLTVPLFRVGSITLTLGWLLELLLLFICVLMVTVGVKRLLKGVLLAKLGIDQGNREALSTLVSYSLGTLGLILVVQASGVDLASLAIVAGGLGVGVGFGLQDGAKNLISGLTLLLERKLKVGDFIDLEGATGYIKEIAIRSTVIQTLDGGDIIVPNSYLVENKILNWTYTNLTGQIRLTVGVDYRSDPLVVVEALLACARRESAVLTQPPPEGRLQGVWREFSGL
ncbi:MAG: mechanosensitive ion channel [Gloeomargaritaceae cyanobacterium C42_A2020_066]|nr:mechanosensitive ion channel [Gloeomargaritaceae cyanobacterium C42_A2020_066]